MSVFARATRILQSEKLANVCKCIIDLCIPWPFSVVFCLQIHKVRQKIVTTKVELEEM